MLGATGQIGRAAVRALSGDGWEVTAASLGGGRDGTWDSGVRTVALEREGRAPCRPRSVRAATSWSTRSRSGAATRRS